jgi:hypothetical protein
VGWGKRAEEYGIQMVQLPLVTRAEIESRMVGGPGRDPKDNRRKEFRRDMATAVRLIKSAADQGGLLTGAEVSLLMNRSLAKIHEYIRTYEEETKDPLPMKGYVLDMGSSPTHKGIICRKYEEGMSPPDIARATGHTQSAVDNYLGSYDRIKVLLRKGFDIPTICQVTGRAARTVAEYLTIVEAYQPRILKKKHRDWLMNRRKKVHKRETFPSDSVTPMLQALEKGGTLDTRPNEIAAPGASEEAGSSTPSRPTRTKREKRPKKRGG